MSSPARTVARTPASRQPDPPTDTRPGELDTLRAATLKELVDAEEKVICERRGKIGLGKDDPALPIVGLALSGGGVRSATFNLGVLQALAARHALRAVDYLSTVSGGGYIGAFLGRFYTRFINRPNGAVDHIEARLRDSSSPEVSWLRRCSEYMTVNVGIETPATAAVMLRSFLTVHVVLGALLVAVLNIANLHRYRAVNRLLESVRPALERVSWLSVPIDLVPALDPWLSLLALVVAAWLIPLMIAYWLPSSSRPESYDRWRLLAFMIASATGIGMSLDAHEVLLAIGMAVTTLSVFFWTEVAWARVALKSPAATVFPAGRAMVRNQFSAWLAAATGVTAIVFGIWFLDALVLWMYPGGMPLHGAFAAIGLTFVILFGPLRWLALWLFAGADGPRWKRRLWRVLIDSSLLPVAACALLLVQWDLVSHEMFHRGADLKGGLVWTAVALVVSAILGARSGIVLANRSSLQVLYAARGSRTYLGASNPYRHANEAGADVTSPQPEDDVAFDRYRPDLAGGPLHLINVVVGQTIDRGSGRRTRNRPGENMAVGPCGLSVGPDSHALWVTGTESQETSTRLIEVGELPAPFVPRRDAEQSRPGRVQTTSMQLSDWIAISGPALSPGEYADTKVGSSLIYGLTNVRTGFWWDSGIEDRDRLGEPMPSVWQRAERSLLHCVRAQACLLAEITGRYTGPFRRYWYLADGGLADSLGIYELVRRKVPIIICSDATRDVDGGLAALANAMRRVRIDFRANIQFLSTEQLLQLVGIPQAVIDSLGTLDEVRFSPNQQSRKHAALARVTYPDTDEYSVLLYIKATMTGNEDEDVLEYHRQHRRFPHESVLDQSLNEAQWESYRELGQHSAWPLFEGGVKWLADVRLALKPEQTGRNCGK